MSCVATSAASCGAHPDLPIRLGVTPGCARPSGSQLNAGHPVIKRAIVLAGDEADKADGLHSAATRQALHFPRARRRDAGVERRSRAPRPPAQLPLPLPLVERPPPRSCACPARRSFADTFRGVSPAAGRVTQRRCRRRSAMSRSRVRLAWPALSTSAPSYARGASPVIGTPPHNAYSTLSRLVVLLSPDSLDLFGGAGLPGASGRGA